MADTTTVHLQDRITLTADASKRERLPSGFLRVRDCRIARTGIQEYRAGELGVTDRPAHQVIRVYRPPEEVFKPESLATFANAPVTDDHPSSGVTTDNAKALTRGWAGDLVEPDQEFVRTTLVFADAGLITKVEAGKVEISNGYDCQLEWIAGTTPAGETYDAIQRQIVGNHIAIVDRGRCGENCRIADAPGSATPACDCEDCRTQEAPPVADEATKTRTITVDGIPVQATDAAAAVIEKLTGERDAARSALTDANAAKAKAEADLAEAASKHAGELDAIKATIPTGDALDRLVADRQTLIGTAKRLAPTLDTTGKTDAEIRKAAVTAKLGDTAVAGRDDVYFTHAFDALVAQLPKDGNQTPGATQGTSAADQLAQGVQNGIQVTTPATASDAAWAKGVDDLNNAWKDPAPGATH